jgi:hypothetical protein
MNPLMAPLPLLLVAAAFLQPPQAPEAPPCLIAQLFFDHDEFDEVARATLDRAMDGVRRVTANVLVYASGMQYPDGSNGSGERSLRRGGMIRDHLIARGLPAERIRVVGAAEGWERFGNPGDHGALVLIEYSRARQGMTITGYVGRSSGCSTVVRRPFR